MNTIYLVCVHHPDKADALVLAERFGLEQYLREAGHQQFTKFMERHKLCGGGFDHFTIAYDQVKDHDLPKPAPLANGVHLALREAANAPSVSGIMSNDHRDNIVMDAFSSSEVADGPQSA